MKMHFDPVFHLPALLVLVAASAGAEPDIHRCTQEDGTIAFQGTPCEEPADPPTDDGGDAETEAADRGEIGDAEVATDSSGFVNPFDEPEGPSTPGNVELPDELSEDRGVCVQTTRDAIDAIDLEMREGYTREEGRQYLAELLELTQQLRACKRL